MFSHFDFTSFPQPPESDLQLFFDLNEVFCCLDISVCSKGHFNCNGTAVKLSFSVCVLENTSQHVTTPENSELFVCPHYENTGELTMRNHSIFIIAELKKENMSFNYPHVNPMPHDCVFH